MASTRLLLEGADIESLLAQVREQYGDSARIISADKVRSGGIGGFFSKERYELAVEIEEYQPAASEEWPELPTATHERAAAAIDSVQALLDIADLQENQLSVQRPAIAPAPAPAPAPTPTPSIGGPAPAGAPVTSPYDAIRAAEAFGAAARPAPWVGPNTDLVRPEPARPTPAHAEPAHARPAHAEPTHARPAHARPAHAEPAVADKPEERHPSTAGDEFADILAGLRHDIGSPPSPVTPPLRRPFRPDANTPSPDAYSPPTFAPDPLIGQPTDDAFPGATPILADTLRSEGFTAPAPAQSSSTAPLPAPPPPTPALPAPPVLPPAGAPAPTWEYRDSAEPQHRAVPPATVATPAAGSSDDSLAGALIELGLPANLAQRAVGRDPYSGIVRALGMLPAPPAAPSAAGEILVVAGELTGAMAVAKRAAKQMRIDAASILVVGPTVAGTGLHASRRLTGAADARKRATRLHGADTPHVVVIDAPLETDVAAWFRTVVEALGATAVWAVVDATRKTADVARQLRSFGLVDAIAVHGVAATGDPASVLNLGVPVASLDGRRATPQTWASLLCDLLEHPED